jgi:hypothetical protein
MIGLMRKKKKKERKPTKYKNVLLKKSSTSKMLYRITCKLNALPTNEKETLKGKMLCMSPWSMKIYESRISTYKYENKVNVTT